MKIYGSTIFFFYDIIFLLHEILNIFQKYRKEKEEEGSSNDTTMIHSLSLINSILSLLLLLNSVLMMINERNLFKLYVSFGWICSFVPVFEYISSSPLFSNIICSFDHFFSFLHCFQRLFWLTIDGFLLVRIRFRASCLALEMILYLAQFFAMSFGQE